MQTSPIFSHFQLSPKVHTGLYNRFILFLQGPVAIILIFPETSSSSEKQATGPGLKKRFALFDLLKSLYSDTKILSKYISSLQKRL